MDDFDEFVADGAESLLRTAHLITWDPGEAEDLVQECLFKVARRWPEVRRMQQPLAYARRIVINLAVDGRTGRSRAGSDHDGVWHYDGRLPGHAGADLPVRLALLGRLRIQRQRLARRPVAPLPERHPRRHVALTGAGARHLWLSLRSSGPQGEGHGRC